MEYNNNNYLKCFSKFFFVLNQRDFSGIKYYYFLCNKNFIQTLIFFWLLHKSVCVQKYFILKCTKLIEYKGSSYDFVSISGGECPLEIYSIVPVVN